MPKIVELEQNTPEWLAWRKQHVGGSDAAKLLFLHPYDDLPKDRLTLWMDKTGRLKEKPKTNGDFMTPMQRGQVLEPEARERYCIEAGEFAPPVCMECTDEGLEFMGASLDGWTGERAVELKCPSNARSYLDVKERKIPEHFRIQCQHNMHVAQAEYCDLGVYFNGDLAVVTLEYDVEFVHQQLLPIEREFWAMVKADKFDYPDMGVALDLTNNQDALDKINCLLGHMRMKEEAEDLIQSDKAALMCIMAAAGRGTAPNASLWWMRRKGNLDIRAVPGVEGVLAKYTPEQLDAYRGYESLSLRIDRK